MCINFHILVNIFTLYAIAFSSTPYFKLLKMKKAARNFLSAFYRSFNDFLRNTQRVKYNNKNTKSVTKGN